VILGQVGIFIFSLYSVYFLEYGCTTVFNDVFTKKMRKDVPDYNWSWI